MRKRIVLGVLALLVLTVCVVAWSLGFRERGLNQTPDPVVLGQAETRMWKAYYGGNRTALASELVTILHEQFGLSLRTSGLVGRDLAKAAMTFAGRRGNYEAQTLPHLQEAYDRIHKATGGDWDPDKIARLELAWWAARRTPGENSPEQVGAIIAQQYAAIYGSTNEHVAQAGLLRAEAAHLRDQGIQPDGWPKVEKLLIDSYTSLVRGITPPR